jgi:membrane protein
MNDSSKNDQADPEANSNWPNGLLQDDPWYNRIEIPHPTRRVIGRTLYGVYREGFIHAGNFAYLSIVALFAFCVVAAAIAGTLGQTEAGLKLIEAFFQTVPKSAADALREPVAQAMQARTGPLLWISALIGLWTTGSLMEAVRDVLNRAYDTEAIRHFWEYRLGTLVAIVAAIFLAMLAFSAQVIVLGIEDIVYRYFPAAKTAASYLAWGRIVPFIVLFLSIYVLFRSLTPRAYRNGKYPKWPGAALVSIWWVGTTSVLPLFVSGLANYNLTYGSLAGVMIALVFFYIIGLGMVSGAQLNAALAYVQDANSKQNEKSDIAMNNDKDTK